MLEVAPVIMAHDAWVGVPFGALTLQKIHLLVASVPGLVQKVQVTCVAVSVPVISPTSILSSVPSKAMALLTFPPFICQPEVEVAGTAIPVSAPSKALPPFPELQASLVPPVHLLSAP